MSIERDWLDGLKAIDEQYPEAQAALGRWDRVGKGLLAGRMKCPADQEYGDWLDTTGYRVIKDDERQDSMWLSLNSVTVLPALRETRIGNPCRARRHIRENIPALYSQCQDVRPVTDTSVTDSESTHETNVTVFPSPQPPTALPDVRIVHTAESRPAKLNKQHAFYDLPRGDEIARTLLSKEAPHRIGRSINARGGKEIWSLILQCYDAGFLRNSKYSPGGTGQLSLMLLFPHAPVTYAKRYLVTDQKDRSFIRERIIPAAMAYRDELLAAPDSLEQIVQKYERTNREQATAKIRERRLATARQNLDPTQPEVILYGHHFWPILDIDDPDQRYDYATLTAAAWFFADALSLAMAKTEDNSPRSCGMKIRFLVKRFSLFNKTTDPHDPVRARWLKLFSLVHEMTRLLEKHGHDAATGNRMPLLPIED
jgi:hypothetical protein